MLAPVVRRHHHRPTSLLHYGIYLRGEACHFTYPNGDEAYAVDLNFVCRSYEGTLKRQEEEVLQLRFFAKEELPENLSGNDKKLIEEIWNNQLAA